MRIHSASTTAADRSPAMYRSETIATVVSKTSMNVGMITAAATNQALDRRAADCGRGKCDAAHDACSLGGRGPMRVRVWGPRCLVEAWQTVARVPRRAAPWVAP